ncbi:glycosyltransferase family 4 protein [Cellulosimicrobium cellulans]|uniref:glycosyltransferase family 4 protein n=1 Tax=Cellulosimicrobium cellulans TaxID=1710 RepID=UPI001962DD63|nr:glycosyltransferase family 4 protein [Cellulosimicrobium cellulans]MBN0042181.1 glycosyltransferase family 4 protein [Cellulosimicrobium cellulans]
MSPRTGRTASTGPAGRPRRLVHVITPGDHFSPRTGSAVPTVVDGLSRHARPDGPRPAVVVAAGTYPDRYDSAEVLEYAPARAGRADRWVDAAAGRLGLARPGARRVLGATLAAQGAWDPGVVLAHNAPALVPLVDADRHVPVLYAHNQVLGSWSERDAGRALDPAAAIVCVSDHLAGAVASRLPLRLRERVRTVRNGVDATAFAVPRPPRGDALRVVYVGRVIPDKGVHVLLDAVVALGRADVELTVLGRPGFAADAPLTGYERDLRRTAERAAGPVRFGSFVPRPALPGLLAAADVVVVPSAWPEPFALTALEGMAAGAAVVASDVGGVPEAVGDAGILVPPGDAATLAGALEALADDPSALDRAARAAVEHARRHDWRVAAARLDEVLAPFTAATQPTGSAR